MSFITKIKWSVRKFLIDHFPRIIVEHEWPGFAGRKIDWKNPRDINEKIQWLICYSDTTEWSRLTDKYLVREYVKEKGLAELLPELYGVWEDANQIDFDALPGKFVLKCNHDSGSVIVVDKSKNNDYKAIISDLNRNLKRKFGYVGCEPHYNRIKPLIIAEQYLESHDPSVSFSSSLVDYKVWCFNGIPFSIWGCYGRNNGHAYVNEYDLAWNVHPEYSVFNEHYRNGDGRLPRPKKLESMLECSKALSEGFPEVRVDFYEVDGQLFFGEMTFTSLAGRMDFYTEQYMEKMGQSIILPPCRKFR